jgi:PAS domain S-box-containing protein
MTDRSQQDLDALPLLEAMTESVLVTTTELDRPGPLIVYVNPAFERMTGWPRDEVLGQSPRILQGPKTDHGIFRDLRERLDRGEAWLGQTINYRKDGSEFVMEWSIVPIRNARGRIYRYLAVQRDVTERVTMERNLAAARADERKWFQQVEDTNRKLIQMNTEQQETLDLFVKYVPETVVEKGLKARGGSLFRGEQLDVVALFCDMRDFTPLSERLAPDAVVELLNTYYTMMAKVIAAHEGVVNQFVGDEIFAVFGAPLPIRDCVGSAVRCAVAMVQRLEAINARVRTAIGQEIRVGIGLNYGPVIAGNLGSRDRISYSVTGDTVNTAKRIEALAKTGTNTILIGESVYEAAPHLVTTRPWPAIPLKGKEAEVKVYEVLGLRGARHDGTGRERG